MLVRSELSLERTESFVDPSNDLILDHPVPLTLTDEVRGVLEAPLLAEYDLPAITANLDRSESFEWWAKAALTFAIYNTSNRPAAPIPPPMHMVQTTYFTPRRLPSIRAWPTIRAPLMP